MSDPELLSKARELIELFSNKGDNSLKIRTGGSEWMKMVATAAVMVILQTATIVAWGTHLIDNHDSRISAVEATVKVIPEIQTGISSIKETVGRIDERTKKLP